MQQEFLEDNDDIYEQEVGEQDSPTSGLLAVSGRFRASDPGRFDVDIERIARREAKG